MGGILFRIVPVDGIKLHARSTTIPASSSSFPSRAVHGIRRWRSFNQHLQRIGGKGISFPIFRGNGALRLLPSKSSGDGHDAGCIALKLVALCFYGEPQDKRIFSPA